MKSLFGLLFVISCSNLVAQVNFRITHPIVEEIFTGNYEPADYMPEQPVANSNELGETLKELINPTSLEQLKSNLEAYQYSDHEINESSEFIYAKLTEFAAQNNNRLKPFYLKYDDESGECTPHKIAGALLPGKYTNTQDVVLVEALGQDNIVGEAALVLELARIMSALDFDSNLLFMINVDEEEAKTAKSAFTKYCDAKDLSVGVRFDYNIITNWGDKFPGVFMAYRGCR